MRETAGPRVGGKHTAAAEAAVREESSRVDVQGVAEFPVVVREVLSSTGPQSELDAAMATYAVTLGCLTGAQGEAEHWCGEYWCAQLMQPIQRPIADVDRPRYDPAYVGADGDGLFAWTHYIALRPHAAGALEPGAQSVVADFAYVVDASLGAGTVFDSTKVDWVATVVVDAVLAQSAEPEPQPEPEEQAAPRAPLPRAAVGQEPSPREQLSQVGSEVSSERFGGALDGVLTTLASLSGSVIGELPRPQEVKARKQSRHRGHGPTYSFTGSEVRYQTVDPVRGEVSVSTADPEEALYWMVDDVARSLAWSWAQRTPASRTMDRDQVKWLLAVPMWLTLVTALDGEWARKTRGRISELRKHAQRRGADNTTVSRPGG
ncbi:hypothetical protein [Mycolicibacterium aromaticivorans]|uniref:hypothetical protein n=1 Tax=Mycolicibacterium aromaticivorans TaxID=318425 RepID=UPI0012FF4CC5|nr:hypothetical protein [Mycolicibacterium aromaticivorans]